MIGGSVQLLYNYGNSFYINLYPNIGRFFTKNICLGISPFVFYSIDDEYTQMGVSQLGRYYFLKRERTAFLFQESIMCKTDFSDVKPDIELGIGHTFFINNSVGIENLIIANTDDVEYRLGIQIYLIKK